jgi:peptidoglycan/LPS O-acetylase OafA/YrhL
VSAPVPTLKLAPRLPYLPGVDGLRAVAVSAVFLYHADVPWMPGGFLGVDVFLVISGFLITSLLLAEWDATGRVDVRRFWLRRARRLLPAVFVLLGVCLIVGALFFRHDLARLRGDSLAAAAYVMNWHLVLGHQSYFEAFGRPPVLQHLWSLAVEEQFYLLWPLVFVAGLVLLGRRRLVIAVALTAVASTVLMAILFTPGADPSRVFYGTDTRAIGLIVGVLLGFAWRPGQLTRRTGAGASLVLDAVGGLALVAVVVSFWRVQSFDPSLYRGGFGLVSGASAVVIAVLVHPAARLGRALGVEPLRWLGVRSYGIYLWHWPVLCVTRPHVDVPFGGPLLVAGQAALTVALASASYSWVEQPIRRGGALARLRERLRAAQPRARFGLAGAVAAVIAALVWTFAAPAPAPAPALASVARTPAPGAVAAQRAAAARAPAGRGPALAIGDSVMLGAADGLIHALGPRTSVDAAVSRQPTAIVDELRRLRASGGLPARVVVQMGNNGPLVGNELGQLRDVLQGVDRVVLVTVRVPRRWQDEVNERVRAAIEGWQGATLADWNAVSARGGGAGLFRDGVHLTPRGVALYSDTIKRALSA